jgi:hypothetical protein
MNRMEDDGQDDRECQRIQKRPRNDEGNHHDKQGEDA